MNRPLYYLFALVFAGFCGVSAAQSYEFRQGYIFEQKYVKRISVDQAEQVIGSPGLFEPLLSWNWGKEVIRDAHVKRAGDRLIVQFDGKAPLSLRDFVRKSTSHSEGESQTFKYIKHVPKYRIVGVEFGHDQPAFLLVSDSGSAIYFVDTH